MDVTISKMKSLKAVYHRFERIALVLQGGGALGSYRGDVYQGPAEATRTLTFPEMQALADRLQARGASALGSDSSQSQSDMKLAAAAIRGLLARCVVAGETVGQLDLDLTAAVTLGRC